VFFWDPCTRSHWPTTCSPRLPPLGARFFQKIFFGSGYPPLCVCLTRTLAQLFPGGLFLVYLRLFSLDTCSLARLFFFLEPPFARCIFSPRSRPLSPHFPSFVQLSLDQGGFPQLVNFLPPCLPDPKLFVMTVPLPFLNVLYETFPRLFHLLCILSELSPYPSTCVVSSHPTPVRVPAAAQAGMEWFVLHVLKPGVASDFLGNFPTLDAHCPPGFFFLFFFTARLLYT